MKTYEVLSLQNVIDALRALPADAWVVGIDGGLHSDRGYYTHSATNPADYPLRAIDLANAMQEQIGKPTQGWKGGDYTVSLALPVHVGDYGVTGPSIAAFELNSETGNYEVVAIEDAWF